MATGTPTPIPPRIPRRIPPAALAAILRVAGKPLLGSPLPPQVQRLGTSALCAAMPRLRVPRSKAEIAGVPVLELTPADSRHGATVLYFHGGGYMVSSPADHLGLLTYLAVAARARVIAVDYRKAPEHPFPAAHTDAVNVYRALIQGGQDPARLTVAGDSAGGGLALGTAIAARDDADLKAPAKLFLISPWIDLRQGAATDDSGDALLSVAGAERWAAAYAAGHPRTDPRMSPLLAPLWGLPPTLIQYDSAETIAGFSSAFVEQAREAGSSVEAQPFSGLWHDFQIFTQLPQARRALTLAGAWIAADL